MRFVSVPMFDTSLILVGAQFIVKGGVQPLSYTFMQGTCLYSNYGSALRPRLQVESPLKPPADPVGSHHLTYEAPVPPTFTLQVTGWPGGPVTLDSPDPHISHNLPALGLTKNHSEFSSC